MMATLAADGNGDGTIDTKDYDVSRAYFGKVFSPAAAAENLLATAAVPEPSSVLLVVIGLTAAGRILARRRSQTATA